MGMNNLTSAQVAITIMISVKLYHQSVEKCEPFKYYCNARFYYNIYHAYVYFFSFFFVYLVDCDTSRCFFWYTVNKCVKNTTVQY